MESKNAFKYAAYSAALAASYLLLLRFRWLDGTMIFSWSALDDYTSYRGAVDIALAACVASAAAVSFRMEALAWRNGLALFAVGFLLTLPFWNVPQVSNDHARLLSEVKVLTEGRFGEYLGTIGRARQVDMPLPSILHAAAVVLLGERPLTFTLVQAMIYGLLVYMTFAVARRVSDSDVAVAAALMVAVVPNMLAQSTLVLADTLLTLMVLVLLNELLRLEEHPARYATAAMAFTLVALTKATGIVFAVGAVAAVFAWRWSRGAKVNWRVLGAAGSITVLAAALAAALFWGSMANHMNVVLYEAGSFLSPSKHVERFTVPSPSRTHTISFLFQVGPILFPLALAFLISRLIIDRRNPAFLLLLFWIIVPYLVLHDLRIRYLMPTYPALAIAAALFLSMLSDVGFRKYVAGTLIVAPLLVAYLIYLPLMEDSREKNIRDAGLYLNTLEGVKNVVVYTIYANPAFNPSPVAAALDYWTAKDIQYGGKEYPNAEWMNWGAAYRPPRAYMEKQTEALTPQYRARYRLVGEFTGGRNDVMGTSIVRVYLSRVEADYDALVLVSNSRTVADNIEGNTRGYRFIEHLNEALNRSHAAGEQILVENWGEGDMLLLRPWSKGDVRLDYNLELSGESTLEFSTGLKPAAWSESDDGMEFRVEVDGREVYRRYSNPRWNPADREFEGVKAKLEPGRHTVSFIASAGPAYNSRWDEGGFIEPRIV